MMKKFFFLNLIKIFLLIIICFSIVGYPLIVSTGLILNLNNHNLSIFARSIILFISIICLMFRLLKAKKFILLNGIFLFLLFIYGVRLIFETSFHPNVLGHSASFYWIWYLGVLLIPLLVIIFCFEKSSDLEIIFSLIKYSLAICNIIFLLNYTYINFRARLDNLNPISLGYVGASLALLVIWELNFKKKLNFKLVIINSLLIFLGIYIMMASGSKGIFFSFIVTIFFLFFCSKKISLNNLIRFLVLFFFFIFTLFLIFKFDIFSKFYSSDLFAVVNRIKNLRHDLSTLQRIDLYKQAFQSITSNPVFGSQIEIRSYKIYPHNLFLEYTMATGLFFGLTLIFFCIFLIFKGLILFKNNSRHGWIFFLFIQNFVQSMFSGCVYLSVEFWVTLILSVIVISENVNNNFFRHKVI
jgi:hypothetical protein